MNDNKIIFGFHAVMALLKHQPDLVLNLYCQDNRDDERIRDVLSLAEQHHIAVKSLNERRFIDFKSGTVKHQGLIASCRQFPLLSEKSLFTLLEEREQSALVLVLDGVQDPHNLGACLRTADAMGVQVVIIPKNRAVAITDTVAKVACGAASTVPVVQVTNLARCLRDLQQQGLWLVGMDAEVDDTISELDLKGPIAIVMGGEGQGLRQLTRKHCDFLAKIPMKGSVASLNVSVAAAITLYEVRRQRLLG